VRCGTVDAMRWWIAVLGLVACKSGEETCIGGECPAPCARLEYVCEPRDLEALYVGRLADAPAEYRLRFGHGADDDFLISNGRVTGVISAPAHDSDLAPTGGNLIDYGPAGGVDDLTISYQLAGILPEDAFAYREIEIEADEDRVAITLRGTLDGRAEVKIATHYELGRCDPGLRVRSELWNGGFDHHAWFVADATHHGKRRVLPFSPGKDRGYLAPELELLELADLWQPHDFDAGASQDPESPGYAAVSCSEEELFGVDDPEIAASGTPMEVVEPGKTLVYERILITAGAGQGPRPAIDRALEARAQLFEEEITAISGRIVAGGMPFGGDVRRASIVVRRDGEPVNAVVPAADGTFAVAAPIRPASDGQSTLELEIHSFGREVARVPIGEDGDAGDLEVPLPATAQISVLLDGVAGIHALVAFHPADDATRAAVTGSFHGRSGECAPWLGSPNGGSPACNRALIDPRGSELEVPPGRYQIVATAGPEHTLAMIEVELVGGEITPITLSLQRLLLVPVGWVTADLHVHGRASFDSGIPDDDRVRTFAAAGVQVIAATDHDVIGDYSETVRALGLEGSIAVLGGLEATQLIPWLDVEGEDLPRVIGHFNFWPLAQLPGEPRAGAPSDEGIEPGTLFDRMAPLVGEGGMMMMNHPWDETLFGRDLGYLRAINFDPRVPIRDGDTLLRRPSNGRRNIDWNIIEIINGADTVEMQKARVLWHSLLAQGFVVSGAGNSDSHSMSDAQLGWARNWVDASANAIEHFDADRFDAALVAGRFSAGNGVVVRVELVDANGGHFPAALDPVTPGAGAKLAITITAPPWVPVTEVRVVTSAGTRVLASGSELAQPADPFGTAGVLRFSRQVPISELVSRDDFVIVEAGVPYPLLGDLDDDGVGDTTDNDLDGDVDEDDVEEDEDTGPANPPPDPTDPADPRYWLTRVVPGAVPAGFANPVLIDVAGDGWTPPGLR
jgi:hypothetical protein